MFAVNAIISIRKMVYVNPKKYKRADAIRMLIGVTDIFVSRIRQAARTRNDKGNSVALYEVSE